MILYDVYLYGSGEKKHIHTRGPLIHAIVSDREMVEVSSAEIQLEMKGAAIFPAFINSHDHLDFNCYPRLGNQTYANYTQWGKDIHLVNADIIAAVQKIPQALRVQWGLYKNLLNGFTTVVNHGDQLQTNNDIVNVFQDCYSLHSPAFEKNWRLKLIHPWHTKKPFVMHLGEGTDAAAHLEIDRVIKANFFNRNMVAVHGVAMEERQAAAFKGLICCPASNYFLLGKTADIHQLKTQTSIVFGTDSALTAPWQAGEHFRMALEQKLFSADELFAMLTKAPAALWGLTDKGIIEEGKRADLIVVKENKDLFANTPGQMELVTVNGEIRVASGQLFGQLPDSVNANLDRIDFDSNPVYVKKGIVQLATAIRSYYPELEMPFSISDNNP